MFTLAWPKKWGAGPPALKVTTPLRHMVSINKGRHLVSFLVSMILYEPTPKYLDQCKKFQKKSILIK